MAYNRHGVDPLQGILFFGGIVLLLLGRYILGASALVGSFALYWLSPRQEALAKKLDPHEHDSDAHP